MGTRRFLLLILCWGLPGVFFDLLVRWTSWLGPAQPGGLKTGYPVLWLVWVVVLGGLMGYQELTRPGRYSFARAVVAFAFFLAFLAGYPTLGGAGWLIAWVALGLLTVALAIATEMDKRRHSVERAEGTP